MAPKKSSENEIVNSSEEEYAEVSVAEESGSDSEGSEEYAPKSKKHKGDSKVKKSTPCDLEKDDNGEMFVKLSAMRRVTVSSWKGKPMINIREFYRDQNDVLKPGKKGISLNLEQWNTLKKNMDAIDKAVSQL